MKPRKLTESEVRFTVELEPEDLDYEGHFSDPRDVELIRKRLEAGQGEAWCCLTVRATWHGFTGVDHLGGVSLDCGQHPMGSKVHRHAEKFARESDMYSQALDDLNKTIAAKFARLEQLITDDSEPPAGR